MLDKRASWLPNWGLALLTSKLVFTASASNGVPSWKVTSGRTLMVHTVASALAVIDSARYGTTLPLGVVRGQGVEDGPGHVVTAGRPRVDARVVAARVGVDADDERAAAGGLDLGVGGGRRVGQHRRGGFGASRRAAGARLRGCGVLGRVAAAGRRHGRDERECGDATKWTE